MWQWLQGVTGKGVNRATHGYGQPGALCGVGIHPAPWGAQGVPSLQQADRHTHSSHRERSPEDPELAATMCCPAGASQKLPKAVPPPRRTCPGRGCSPGDSDFWAAAASDLLAGGCRSQVALRGPTRTTPTLARGRPTPAPHRGWLCSSLLPSGGWVSTCHPRCVGVSRAGSMGASESGGTDVARPKLWSAALDPAEPQSSHL